LLQPQVLTHLSELLCLLLRLGFAFTAHNHFGFLV
jgi:hypothetical protein